MIARPARSHSPIYLEIDECSEETRRRLDAPEMITIFGTDVEVVNIIGGYFHLNLFVNPIPIWIQLLPIAFNSFEIN